MFFLKLLIDIYGAAFLRIFMKICNELEIELAMGHIPAEYRKSYYDNISHIAALLQKANDPNTVKEVKPFFETDIGKLYNGDCFEIMKAMPESCVDLVFADPPFNLGKTYDPGIDDNMTMSFSVSCARNRSASATSSA